MDAHKLPFGSKVARSDGLFLAPTKCIYKLDFQACSLHASDERKLHTRGHVQLACVCAEAPATAAHVARHKNAIGYRQTKQPSLSFLPAPMAVPRLAQLPPSILSHAEPPRYSNSLRYQLRCQWLPRESQARHRWFLASYLQGDTFSISAVVLSIKVPYFSNSCTKTRK
eukprot:SAG31_NODE_4953_length_2837_cov_1.979547_5_plen_169_part_00